MRIKLRTAILTLLSLAAGAAATAAVVLYAGFYNIAATHQHFRPTFWLLKTGLKESVERHARAITAPPLGDPALAQRGLVVFHKHCVQCHGAPGVAPEPFALGMTPVPTNLTHNAREYTDAELYWIVKNGIKMTAMPAWEFRLADADLWALVAFMREIDQVSPEQYAARLKGSESPVSSNEAPTRGDAKRGKIALEQYACVTCHRIPGVVGEQAPVGPPLDRIATRAVLGGVIPNNHENMVRWLREPQEISPRTAMPNLGVTDRDARDMAAYLYTLK